MLPWCLSVTVVLVGLGADSHAIMVSVIGGLIMGSLMLAQNWADRMRGLSLYTPTIVLFSLLASVFLSFEQHENEQESRIALARNLQLQQNPITEYMFADLEKKITSDRGLRNTLAIVPMESEKVLKALHQPFTYDHWNQYRTIVHLFNTDGGLMMSDQKRAGQNYFELQREFDASKPTHSKHLHYVGNWDSDGGYLARLELIGRRGKNDLILFVRLIPEKTDNILGFTDLFVDEGISNAKELEGYSYALYAQNELQVRSGDFPYSLSASSYTDFTTESSFWDQDDYSHLVHRPIEDRLVIVSRRNDGLIGYLTIFSYLFLFYFICTTIIVLANGKAMHQLLSGGSFRSRINVAMSSVLFVSLFIIGLLTVFYVVREYHARNEEMISEKSRSVLIELEHKLRDRRSFDASDQATLSTLLTKFSKVFFTDINLYQLDGHLLATSRQRLFDEGLMAKVIEPNAYTQMRFNQKSSFIQEETIGNLNYLTAYVPFRNEQREVIAFMSLPYFARQYGLQQEVFSLLAALTNIYVFLILLSVVMALIISNRITEPLRFIRESLKNLKLDQQNRTIEWESNDEIGELVQEYNRTLNELVQSAELLARSERESAWREMAKQVAHEIKNPLTPMKLSIQMLQRSMADGAEDINERIKKVSDTLIEQIDTLSNIATEFSSFAQMPKPVIENLNLQTLLENAAELHGNS
ncbi:MAG: histidine kinase dimerization/phospho-acceptor domain-containing protein, partial [Flavobacteriales bacterium]|nr:histidine kinase dimerization/phospho-acceptor domain-containing protein [Flavobacteriales bacterium]